MGGITDERGKGLYNDKLFYVFSRSILTYLVPGINQDRQCCFYAHFTEQLFKRYAPYAPGHIMNIFTEENTDNKMSHRIFTVLGEGTLSAKAVKGINHSSVTFREFQERKLSYITKR